jgi:hypothetical protein
MSPGENLPAARGRGFARIPDGLLLAAQGLVLLAILAAAWNARSAMPAVPISDPDTWGYLNPALSWLGGLGFRQTAGRDWLYPAFLAFFLKSTGSFAGIVFWQKFVGISSGLVMAIAWKCWVSTLPLRRPTLFLVSMIGALPISFQLMNPQSILFEMAIRPEALLPFFVYAQFACLIGYYKFRWQTPSALSSVVLGAAAIVLAYACALLKPSWLLAAALTAAPVFLGIFGSAQSLKTRLLTPALGFGRKIWVQFTYFLLPKGATFFRDRGDVTRFYRDSVTILDQSLPDGSRANVRAMYLHYKTDVVAQAGSDLTLKSKFHACREVIASLALPLEILFSLTFASCLVWARFRDLRSSGWAAASLFCAPLGNALMVCVVHALDVERYRLTYGGFLLFDLTAMAVFISLVIARFCDIRRECFRMGPTARYTNQPPVPTACN